MRLANGLCQSSTSTETQYEPFSQRLLPVTSCDTGGSSFCVSVLPTLTIYFTKVFQQIINKRGWSYCMIKIHCLPSEIVRRATSSSTLRTAVILQSCRQFPMLLSLFQTIVLAHLLITLYNYFKSTAEFVSQTRVSGTYHQLCSTPYHLGTLSFPFVILS